MVPRFILANLHPAHFTEVTGRHSLLLYELFTACTKENRQKVKQDETLANSLQCIVQA